MNHDNHKKSGRDEILSRIKQEGVAMKPRLFFTAQIIAIAATALATLVVSVFIFNFILFSIRINSHDAFLAFGPRGFLAFLRFFPWPFLLADIGLIILLEWLIRQFRFGYRMPIAYVVGGILALTLVLGLTLDRGTFLNDHLMQNAGGPGIPPPIGRMYRDARNGPHDGICRCTVTAIDGNMLTVEDYRNGATSTFTVILPENDRRATTTGISVGDVVMVAGDRNGNEIRAFGVKKAMDRFMPVPGGPKPEMK